MKHVKNKIINLIIKGRDQIARNKLSTFYKSIRFEHFNDPNQRPVIGFLSAVYS
jgi:hypothetical protein